ncbi:RmlC-like cupin domain-containing protein [Immersiella caudata]|uniref:Mannose-6-phosphate isomerase n=1 Tax=Immersiella caudata TaxID=314043 RepID=A0AA39WEJ2_9PEZI|nr:RmlC-like cupin domain-containing protein [Immersiella caudata]
MTERVFRFKGACNNYPWGRTGSESLASQLQRKNDRDFQLTEDAFYSELWFGDYPNFLARLLEAGELLKDVIGQNKEGMLGKTASEALDGNLPFLPKILSIAKALPLQFHPNKGLAAKLHEQDPGNFKDPNHKPEIAVALSRFEIFAGFKPLPEIEPLFRLPPLQQFGPSLADAAARSDKELREVVRSMLEADAKTIKSLITLLYTNFLILNPGEAIYMPADDIHAYLSGDIVEYMARSDNVLNLGFCTHAERYYLDVFTNALTFEAHSTNDVMLSSQKSEKSKSGRTVVFSRLFASSTLLKADLQAEESDKISASDGLGVFIITKGEGDLIADGKEFDLSKGSIFFVAQGIPVE